MSKYSPYAIAENKSPEWKPGEELAAAALIGVAISLVIDINISIWRVFRKRSGLYYWAMQLGTLGILVDAAGVILKFLLPHPYHLWILYSALLCIGWSIYSPAQLLVLYSRLHLVNDGRKTQRWILIMSLSTIPLFIVPTWVTVWFAWNPDEKVSALWSPREAIVERYNQIGFTLAEMILSGVYIWSLLGLLNLKSSVRQRRVMLDLVYVNMIIILLDVAVVLLNYLNETGISHPLQTFTYALKLKLEFGILNQLMAVAARGVRRTNFEERRYHHDSSAKDPFSAECHQWGRKPNDSPTKGHRPSGQQESELQKLDSVQITLPSPTVSKSPQRSPTHDLEKPGETGPLSDPQAKTFLDLEAIKDPEDPDPIHHKSSEEFSGSTLPEGEESPHLLHDNRPPTSSSQHQVTNYSRPRRRHNQSQANFNQPPSQSAGTPYIAKIRRSIPKNARYVNHAVEDEEEEIGVHMWENRKGNLELQIPWFRPPGEY